jgi:ribose transport system permease protein
MRPKLGRLLSHPWVGPLIALIAVYLLFASLRAQTFATANAFEVMLRQTAVVAIAAVGMTLVMVQGGIDLSVGSVVALTTVVIASALRSGLGPFTAASLGIAGAVATGLLNGVLVSWLRITPFIVTLGTMSALRGLAIGLADEQKIDAEPRGLDSWMSSLAPDERYKLLPAGVWLALLVSLTFAFVLHYTRVGRHLVAVGSNPLAARLSGVSIPRITVLAYAIAGLCAGLAGLLEYSKLTVGDPTDSAGLELVVIAAVVIGGGSISGGQGSIAGTVLGALLMTFIRTGCNHVGVPNWVQQIITGVIIAAAVTLDRFRRDATA